MSSVLERVYIKIRGPCVFVFESRGRKEDEIVRGWFDAIVEGSNPLNKALPFSLLFSRKQDNVIGTQMADLACRPILHYVKKGENQRPDWQAVRSRIRQSPQKKIAGSVLRFSLKAESALIAKRVSRQPG